MPQRRMAAVEKVLARSRREAMPLPSAIPIKKVTRIRAKACMEEPMAIESASDQTTSDVIAQAPEMAKLQMASLRPSAARGSTQEAVGVVASRAGGSCPLAA